MRFDLSVSGKRFRLKVSGEEVSAAEARGILEALAKVERHLTKEELHERVVRQLKADIEEGFQEQWWDVPQDLLKSKDAGAFIAMETDLNASLWYDKLSFPLKMLVTERGKELVFDRDALKSAFHRIGLGDRLRKTSSALVRVKGSLSPEVVAELKDGLRKLIPVERLKILVEKKEYGNRASMDLILFGDFPPEQSA
jgi:hypothetical protein